MPEQRKKINEITRDEWIVWNWIYCSEFNESEKFYVRGVERDPSGSIRAGREYDEWKAAYDVVNQKEKRLLCQRAYS